MTDKLETQTKNALEFVKKLFFEVSYLIKEIEGQLELNNFDIGRPSGYGVTSRTSTGLEQRNVDLWLPKTFSVFFIERKNSSNLSRGRTNTKFAPNLKVLLYHFDFSYQLNLKPVVYFGVIYNIKPKLRGLKKWEEAFSHLFGYNPEKIFLNPSKVSYSDTYASFKGKFKKISLLSIQDSNDIQTRLINPILKMHEKIG